MPEKLGVFKLQERHRAVKTVCETIIQLKPRR